MTRRQTADVIGSLLLAVAAAEAGRRLLSPPAGGITAQRVELREHFSAEEIERGARYSRPQVALALGRSAIDLAALSLLVRHPPALLRGRRRHPIAAAGATASGLAVALSLPPLPLAAIARRRAIRVGLVTQSWGGWAVDLLKASGIQAALTAVAGTGATWLMRRYPRRWWAPAAAGSVAVGAGLSALAPVLLDPVFNDFTPLPDGETRDDVLALAAAAGVRVGQVYSVDASRRTTAANAYVNGLGPTKRVVLFDTLLDRYSRDEIRVVVAHELAHVRHRDVARGILYAAIVAPAAALAAQRLSWRLSPERGTAAALPALALAAAVVSAPSGVIGNGLSRAVERRADRYALELSGAVDAFVSFERAIALQNVADLDPPRWVQRLATHPPTAERIGIALAYRNAAA